MSLSEKRNRLVEDLSYLPDRFERFTYLVDYGRNKETLSFLAASNRVGVNTKTPGTTLDVNGSTRVGGAIWPATGAGMEMAYDSGANKGYIQVYNRDTSTWGNLYLGNGSAGIGTTAPSGKLEAYDSANGTRARLATSLDGLYASSGKSNGSAIAGINTNNGNGV